MKDAKIQSAISHWAPRFVSNGVLLAEITRAGEGQRGVDEPGAVRGGDEDEVVDDGRRAVRRGGGEFVFPLDLAGGDVEGDDFAARRHGPAFAGSPAARKFFASSEFILSFSDGFVGSFFRYSASVAAASSNLFCFAAITVKREREV